MTLVKILGSVFPHSRVTVHFLSERTESKAVLSDKSCAFGYAELASCASALPPQSLLLFYDIMLQHPSAMFTASAFPSVAF